VDYDDGYIAYLNGVEISRENMAGEAPRPYDEFTTTYVEKARLFRGLDLIPNNLSEYSDVLVDGENVLAIQVHNTSTTSSDMTLIPFLSLGYSELQEETRGTAEATNLPNSENIFPHLNFKLSSDGETVVLTNPEEQIVDEITYPPLNPDESYGRSEADPEIWLIFSEPTPLAANTTEGYTSRLSIPELTHTGGFYNNSINIDFADITAGNVYYTTDGNIPDEEASVFEPPFEVNETTVLRLRAIEDGQLSSNVETYTYFINAEHDLPVISLSTEPDNFFSAERGIYVEGINGIEGHCSNGPVNWNQDWERPVYIEFYETDGSKAFSSGAGTKIFGGCSRTNPQKSLSIFFRGEYGNPELNYKLFEEKEIETFQAFVLRNSGNDFTSQGHSMFRDGLMKTLIEDTELDYQAFRPVVVYLNGEYWGIHNIREKVNEHFIESNSNADSDNIDILENNGSVIHGSAQNYNEFLDALGAANMQNEEEYLAVENMIDIDNYVDYMAAQIYYANTDWPGNNIKYWRNHLSNQGWRWIIYDTDFGFSLSYGGHYTHNTLAFALEPNGPGWPNPPWSTYVLRRFVESDIFIRKFVNRMSDLMNTVFQPDYVHDVIDSLSQKIAGEMPDHIDKWGNSMGSWEGQIQTLKNFANSRPGYIEGFLEEEFGLTSQKNITVNVSHGNRGAIKVNKIFPDVFPWTGKYFGGIPIEITAIPNQGYKFTGWSGASTSTERTIQVDAAEEPNLTANFDALSGEEADIVINEIMYNAPDEEDPQDWIELFNPNDFAVNLSGWIVKDEDDNHEFIIPENTIIAEEGYLVVAQNLNDFVAMYGTLEPVVGNLGFGLGGGGDQVRIFDLSGVMVDSVEYDDVAPWPFEADGNGYSLELNDPFLDNELGENWDASLQYMGTPTTKNGIITSNELENEIPTSISLNQNYPNPFNPTTVISFQLNENSEVSLQVFDMLGRRVATLIDGERRSAGVHQVSFDANNLASGMYIYRLRVGDHIFHKKMLFTK
ncbi:MAG: CotH kinase family protein, partial [Gracilimonas sp.]